MSQTYSTEDLIQILANERQACLSGKRLNLRVSLSGSPFLDQFLASDGIQKFTAYHDFRATIHQYQRQHQVSGIIWQTLTMRDKSLHYPKVHDQLIGLPQDLEILRTATSSILRFWQDVTRDMDLYQSFNGGKFYRPTTLVEIERITRYTEWASLSQQGHSDSLEIILQLGWGKPEEAAYKQGWPESGSEHIHAVHAGKRPLS